MQTKTAIFHLQETILSKNNVFILYTTVYIYRNSFFFVIYYAILRLTNLNSNITIYFILFNAS